MIIGLTGGYGSGKDVVAEYFVSKGFKHISLSDFIRKECDSDSLKITRTNMIKEGNKLRKQFGNWILGKMASDMIDAKKDYVVTSIRNPGEVKILKKYKNFVLVNVVAPSEIRFERVLKRNRGDENYSSLNEFLEQENKELKSKNKDSQQLSEVFSMANIVLENKYKHKKELHKVLDKMHKDLILKEEIKKNK